MGKIKSALELALERTADVKIDQDALRRDERINKGKNLAGKFLDAPGDTVFDKEWKGLDKQEITWIKEGIMETLLANLTLPRYETDLSRLQTISDGLTSLFGRGTSRNNIGSMMNHYRDLFKQYLENLSQLEESLRVQWEPRLKQKEELIKKQTGQMIKLLPEQDPEFAKVLSEQLSSLDAQYGEVIAQGKMEIRKLI